MQSVVIRIIYESKELPIRHDDFDTESRIRKYLRKHINDRNVRFSDMSTEWGWGDVYMVEADVSEGDTVSVSAYIKRIDDTVKRAYRYAIGGNT
jgi:hypothetical protein